MVTRTGFHVHIVRTVSECCPCLLDLLDPTCCRLRVDCSFSSLHDPARLYTVYLRNAPFHVHCRWSYIETPRIECRCSRKSGLLIRLVCGTKRGYGQCAIYVTCSISSSAAYLKLQTKLHHPPNNTPTTNTVPTKHQQHVQANLRRGKASINRFHHPLLIAP